MEARHITTDRDRKWDACVAKMKEESQAIVVSKDAAQPKTWIELRSEHEKYLQEKKLAKMGKTSFPPLPQAEPAPAIKHKSLCIHGKGRSILVHPSGFAKIRSALKKKGIDSGDTVFEYVAAVCKYKGLNPLAHVNMPKKTRGKFLKRFLDELDGVPEKVQPPPKVRKPAPVTLKDGSILGAVYVKPTAHPSRKESREERTGFYWSEAWREVRYIALRRSRGVCELCGSGPTLGKPLHVDHIKPRSKYPQLELDPDNLQVLCFDCNLGKSNTDEIDWRRQA